TSSCKAISPTFNVSISPVIKPVLSGPTNLCENDYGTYKIVNRPGHKFIWGLSGGSFFNNQGDTQVTIHWNGGSASGSLIVKDSNLTSGCTISSDILSINLNKITIPIISGNDTFCEGATDVYTILPEANHFYTWNITGGSILSGQNTANISVSWATPGIGSIVLIDSFAISGCKSSSKPIDVWVSAKPNPSISGPGIVCSNASAVYLTSFVPRHGYNWTVNGGTILAGQGTNGLTVFWNGAGIGDVSVTQTDSIAGCSQTTAAFPVLKNLTAAPGISGPASICLNTDGLYTTLSNPDKIFIWEIKGGNILSGQGTNEVTIFWDTKGKGSITLRDSSISSGCTSLSTVYEVNVINAPLALIGGATVKCVGDTANYGSLPSANRTYDWSVSGGTIISGLGTEKITVIWNQGGTGTVYLTETVLSTSCSNSSSRNVRVAEKPSAYFTTRIVGGTVDFNPIKDSLTYYWQFGDGDVSFMNRPAHTYGANGTYTVSLNISNNDGCKNDSSMLLSINTVGLEDFSGMKNGLAAFPNPFSGKTHIVFKIQNQSEVELDVYDMMGNLISKLIDHETLNAGEYEQEFNLDHLHSNHGAYFVRLRIGEQFKTLRIIAQ
ncbi:MAG: PKD domain-containing protein, partial [Bacteroidia bacterium]